MCRTPILYLPDVGPYTQVHMCMYVFMHIHMCMYLCTYVCACMCMYVNVQVHMCAFVYACTYVRMCTVYACTSATLVCMVVVQKHKKKKKGPQPVFSGLHLIHDPQGKHKCA